MKQYTVAVQENVAIEHFNLCIGLYSILHITLRSGHGFKTNTKIKVKISGAGRWVRFARIPNRDAKSKRSSVVF
jgi:hypothetical protein